MKLRSQHCTFCQTISLRKYFIDYVKTVLVMMIHVILSLAALSLPTPGSAGLLGTQKRLGTLDRSVGEYTDGTAAIGVTTLSSQCSTVKSLLSLQYRQYNKSGNEPDLSKLTLNHITQDSNKSYNLSTAAEEIPKSSWFNPDRGLIVYVHGFMQSANGTDSKTIDNAFLRRDQYNIVALDSSSLLTDFNYLRCTTYVTYIGQAFGRVLSALYHAGMPTSSMHLIGHSLGAHICGFAGKTFTNLTGLRVSRITGLDPAGPCYTDVDSSMKLNKTDAEFVDVIHTNAGVFGLDENIGHVDFWPNGGVSQPHCSLQLLCSHRCAPDLFAESVLSDNFEAVACTSWNNFKAQKCNDSNTSLMGFGCSNETRGTYYLQTAASSPFALGDESITYST